MAKIETVDRIKQLIENGEREKAIKKCKENLSNVKVVALYINLLIDDKKYEEAEQLCIDHIRVTAIASQYAYLLMEMGKIDEARDFCEKYYNQEEIAPQYIMILEKENEYNKIADIAYKYPYNRFVNKAYIYVLMELGEYEEALSICERFPHDKNICNLKHRIKTKTNIETKDSIDSDMVMIRNRALKLINENKYKEAKKLTRSYMNDGFMFNLYISILEKERIANNKKGIKKKKYTY